MERELNNFKTLAIDLHKETVGSYIKTSLAFEDWNPIKSYWGHLNYLKGLTVDSLDINELNEGFDSMIDGFERCDINRNLIATLVKYHYELRKAIEDAYTEI